MQKKVLVVDDNLDSLKQISIILGKEYKIFLAKSGAQALTISGQVNPDLILLDVEMPEKDGFQTMEEIRQHPFLCRIPVVFLTGKQDTETEVRALESGAVDFVTKPVNKDILLHRVKLHIQLSAYQRSLEHTVHELEDNLAISFAEMIECRDANTGGHVVRTGRFVEMLGKRLMEKEAFREELNEEKLALIVRAAPLHDIGKIGISDAILLKPGRLTDEEFARMKHHAAIGAEIIRHMLQRTPTQQYLNFAEMIAHFHHERYDGKGYPTGLQGGEIPVCARIMAVADVYDALTDDRIYRKGMSHEEAVGIIMEGRGSQFDPQVVDAFAEICQEMQAAVGRMRV